MFFGCFFWWFWCFFVGFFGAILGLIRGSVLLKRVGQEVHQSGVEWSGVLPGPFCGRVFCFFGGKGWFFLGGKGPFCGVFVFVLYFFGVEKRRV